MQVREMKNDKVETKKERKEEESQKKKSLLDPSNKYYTPQKSYLEDVILEDDLENGTEVLLDELDILEPNNIIQTPTSILNNELYKGVKGRKTNKQKREEEALKGEQISIISTQILSHGRNPSLGKQ